MKDSDITEKPEESAGDVIHTMAKAGLAAIPALGGTVAVLFDEVVLPPMRKRHDEWVKEIATRLVALEKKVEGFKIETLADSPTFVTTFLHATVAAIRNHQQEKVEALRNAVLNAATPNAPDEDLQLMFINYVDSFTKWHVRLLHLLDNPTQWAKANGLNYPDWQIMCSPSKVVEHAFKDLSGQREFYDQVVKDLFNRGLLNTEHLHGTMTVQGALSSRTTDMGRQFLKFITSPTK